MPTEAVNQLRVAVAGDPLLEQVVDGIGAAVTRLLERLERLEVGQGVLVERLRVADEQRARLLRVLGGAAAAVATMADQERVTPPRGCPADSLSRATLL